MMIVEFEFTGADLLTAVNLGLNRLDGVRMFHESTDQEGRLYGIEHVYRLSEAAWIEYRKTDKWQVVLPPLGTGDDADPAWRMLQPYSAAWVGSAARRPRETATIRIPFVILNNISPAGDGVADNPPTRRVTGEIFIKMTGATSGRIEAPPIVRRAVDAIMQGIADANVSWETSAGDTATGAQPDDQAGEPLRPGRRELRAHERARERLRTGEDEATIKADWRKDYEDETGMTPAQTASGEKELWRNVKRAVKIDR